MTRSRPISLLAGAAVIPLAALAVAGCGSGDGDPTASIALPKTAGGRSATVGAATTGLGKILVDSKGRTIYLFEKDKRTRSACSGACAGAWPPVRANGKPTVGDGANASQVGTTTRSDGAPQVTYNGHPLYLYQGDQQPGDTNGQGITAFGAAWFALSPEGNQVSGQPSSSGAGSSSADASGYWSSRAPVTRRGRPWRPCPRLDASGGRPRPDEVRLRLWCSFARLGRAMTRVGLRFAPARLVGTQTP
jgi:predicted lipoprotein with Yx(FWY)xxD motif